MIILENGQSHLLVIGDHEGHSLRRSSLKSSEKLSDRQLGERASSFLRTKRQWHNTDSAIVGIERIHNLCEILIYETSYKSFMDYLNNILQRSMYNNDPPQMSLGM